MKRTMTAAVSVASILALAASAAWADEEKVLNVYNWSDYIAEETIANFEKETGIKVNYDVFDSNEVLEGKLLAGNTGYDIVVPSGAFLERQIQAGVFQELDRNQLPNHGNLDDEILGNVAVHDPGNAHAIPYMWGTTGFGYNIDMINERMADAPVGSWDMIFNPDVVSKFADCGVTLLDASSEVLETALNYLGLDPHTEDKETLAKAEALLLTIRPYIKYFHSSQNINDLANGDICLAMGWSGDMLIARDRADEAEQGINVAYVIPEEGAVMWFDLMAIPAGAPHPQNAHAFLNYIMEPQVVADISNYVFYANGNAAATELVDEEVTGDPGIYPSDEVKANLFADKTVSPKMDRHRTRAWTKIKTGQ
ncbi:MAG: polyamine ABC transporter substrate-binding protein [Alphaproteobacteria bacterium]|nr:polyamine ABC transporter substrate-binding protein [Alphaproteobacteria bacterium]